MDAQPRTLSKSDFKLARSCEAKLYFRENGYPDNRDHDPYLALLAEGGYMVEALAKARYRDAIQLQYDRDLARDFAVTGEHLQRDRVTMFEATLVAGRRQARVDALIKTGDVVRLIEMKAKSFDGTAHAESLAEGGYGVFRTKTKPYRVNSDWAEKLEDVTYQVLLFEKAFPGLQVRPYLALVDKSKRALIDGIPRLFELVHRTGRDGTARLLTARYLGTQEQLASLDLITEVDVSAEVDSLREEVESAAARMESRLDAGLAVFVQGLPRTAECRTCEFKIETGEPDGFNDCWGTRADPRPHMLELFSIGKVKSPDGQSLITTMFEAGTTSLFDVPIDWLVKADGTVGPEAARQRRQIEYTRSNGEFVGPSLRTIIEGLKGPLHFIDFETSRLALPYHATMRPYGQVAFQWSDHVVMEAGATPTHAEWLNDVDVWPNQAFAEALRAQLGDAGSVLTWSHYEQSVMTDIVRDLETFGRDARELARWIDDVFRHRLVDLHRLAQTEYYHPGMRGRTSIKVVLEALWRANPTMRTQFEHWTGLAAPTEEPYAALPPIEINGVWQNVHEGTGAMRAYQEMMYGESQSDPVARKQWAALLKQYCRLDTLSMVLILEHWRRITA